MIVTELMPILIEEAKAHGLGVGPDCESEVSRFIMPQDQLYRSSTSRQRMEIQENFRRLATEMVHEAGRRGLLELRETTFHAARMKLCPLFPFC